MRNVKLSMAFSRCRMFLQKYCSVLSPTSFREIAFPKCHWRPYCLAKLVSHHASYSHFQSTDRSFSTSSLLMLSTVTKELRKPYLMATDPETEAILAEDMLVFPDFLSEEEEQSLLNEVEPYMKRLRYEFDHWDNVSI